MEEENIYYEEPQEEIPEKKKSSGGRIEKADGREGSKAVREYRRTNKRILYARALLDGHTQRQAYMIAYPEHRTWKVSSIDEKASRLFREDSFQTLMEEQARLVEEEMAKQFIWSRNKATKMLLTSARALHDRVEQEIALEPDKRNMAKVLGEIRTMKELIGELNNMHGFNKQNVNLGGEVTIIDGADELED